MSKIIPCSFFSKDGFCAKGDFCDFLHTSAPGKCIRQCQFFHMKAGCRYGNSCAFIHNNQTNSNVTVEKKKDISNAQQLPAGFVVLGKSCQTVENNEPTNTKLTTSEMWGLANDINDDGAYFYGAPGTAPIASKKYADIVGRNSSTPPFERKTDVREPCSFFLAGNCRFGDICRNLHPNMDFIDLDEKIVLQEEERLAKEVNCGICLQPAEDGRLGILSHCDCIFCLKCIREWRKEGTAISKSEVVRLCPLCRNVSYYVIPSTRLITDTNRKETLLNNYLMSLSNITCKFYQNGNCPFGSSCFYQHVDSNGCIVEKVTPNLLLNAEESIQIKNECTLLDFIQEKKRSNR